MHHAGKLFHAELSASSQKIRLALAEKQLAWESEPIDLRKGQQHTLAYRELNPNGVVPILVHDGQVLIESSAILEYLDDAFPERPLRPKDALGRHRMRVWTRKLVDTHEPNGFLTYAVLVRPAMKTADPVQLDARIAAMPDARLRALRYAAMHQGIEAPQFSESVKHVALLLNDMDAALAKTSFLAGPEVSIADLTALPYVARLLHMGWTQELLAGRPHVADWLERMTTRPSYESAIMQWFPPGVSQQWLDLGERAWPAAKAALGS